MIHELKQIIEDFLSAQQSGQACVLATVVDLDGSSYRRPGVRMLIREDGKMTGAVSGGCVEKEILRQSRPVFEDGKARVMIYDGRYRLGCDGILYILIERFHPEEEMIAAFERSVRERLPMVIKSQYARQAEGSEDFGSKIIFEKGLKFKFYGGYGERKAGNTELCDFTQELKPPLKLIIIGAEHDAVQLSSLAGSCGWQVKVIVPSSDPGKPEDFPGSDEVIHSAPEFFEPGQVDRHTAVMLMTHSYVMDLKYLMKFTVSSPKYLGLLGPSVRKEKLFDELLMEFPEIDDAFFDTIYGPAGINIGAETPREIAVSIVGEILSVFRGQDPMPLKEKKGRIHSGIKL